MFFDADGDKSPTYIRPFGLLKKAESRISFDSFSPVAVSSALKSPTCSFVRFSDLLAHLLVSAYLISYFMLAHQHDSPAAAQISSSYTDAGITFQGIVGPTTNLTVGFVTPTDDSQDEFVGEMVAQSSAKWVSRAQLW